MDTDSQVQTQLEAKLQRYLEVATEEETDTLERIITGLLEKQAGKQGTYLGALTNARAAPLEDGTFEMTLPIHPLIYNPLEIVHGGITATLLDSAMGALVDVQLPASKTAVTSQLNIHYIRPGTGSLLRCVARVAHAGSKQFVVEGDVYDDREKLVAKATGTFFVIGRAN
ncbi:PaaI family thioesterase [Shouchella shacheensis]|uniref:PaaI family thioesterase n=1 Tax=Shouchella shacheensis TaxID=1649580 RepID=UPI0007401493|nr:PaaI family thioesterase [Shouchella shacheensis]